MSNNNGGKGGLIFGIIIVIIILGMIGSCSGDHASEDKRCGSCGRTFTNSDDTHSIAWTGMCENCYNNYKFAQEMREEILKYNERYGD